MTPEQRLARKARRYRYVDQGLCPWDGHTATHGQLCDRCYATRQAWLAATGRVTGTPSGRPRSPQGDAWAQAYVAGGTLQGIARAAGVTVGAVQSACRVRGVWPRKGGV